MMKVCRGGIGADRRARCLCSVELIHCEELSVCLFLRIFLVVSIHGGGEVGDFCTHLFKGPQVAGRVIGVSARVSFLQFVPPPHALCELNKMRSQYID